MDPSREAAKKQDKNAVPPPDRPPERAWTREHHLIGSEITRSTLTAAGNSHSSSSNSNNTYNSTFHKVTRTLPAQYFQPNDALSRKPALWRALVCDDEQQQDTALSWDIVSSDWQLMQQATSSQQQQQQLPLDVNLQNVVKDRVQEILYQRVVEDWLPTLVVAAALEECQAVLASQIVQERQAATGDSAAATAASAATIPFPYYSQSPSTYLESNSSGSSSSKQSSSSRLSRDGSSTRLSVKLTPGQLASRIKQGCTLLWNQKERQSNPSVNTKRSSRRILRQQQQQQAKDEPEENTVNGLWKVLPGGKVATFLHQHLLNAPQPRPEPTQEASSTAAPKDTNGAQPASENDDTEMKDASENDAPATEAAAGGEVNLLVDNPYFHVDPMAIMEWLGRKTAKLLSASDLEDAIAALTLEIPPPPKTSSKKKKEAAPAAEVKDPYVTMPPLDPRVVSLLPNSLWRYICHLQDAEVREGDWEGAKLVLVHQDPENASSAPFGRCPYLVQILWEPTVAQRRQEQFESEYTSAQLEAKNARTWGTWRYKSIQDGYTVWPSWLEAVQKWQKETGLAEQQLATLESKTDEQLAKELEASANTTSSGRRSRRSDKGSMGGVFYGSQSNMSPKLVMDAILRLVSQNLYQTTASLVSSIPDESTDPLRRIRGALGKLVWKRNQLARITVQTHWSDSAALKTLHSSSLVELDSEKMSLTEEEAKDLVSYLKMLHQTELYVRSMVIHELSRIPIPIVATAADERQGSMEAMDWVNFDAEHVNSVSWLTSGHKLIGEIIYRPLTSFHTDHSSPSCKWMRIIGYSEPVALSEEGGGGEESAQIGAAKECKYVEIRSRFRAEVTDGSNEGEVILLTEAQVRAGMKAATMEREQSSSSNMDGLSQVNAFLGGKSVVSLVASADSGKPNISGAMVGHRSHIQEDGSVSRNLLLVPDNESSHEMDVVWAKVSSSSSGAIECTLKGDEDETVYTVQQFEYQVGSPAFEECRGIVSFLERHNKARAFLEPVDPVRLGIPHYFTVIKKPMDISTLSKNLESGKYSAVPPNQARGRTAVSRMLNGPFRKDVDLIFDNAMQFNPADDVIHQQAAALKKAVARKIDQIVSAVEANGRYKNSVYEEYESDVDMYEYESDQDEEFVMSSGRGRRKRKRPSGQKPIKEDPSSRVIERPMRLQKLLNEQGVRGSLAGLRIVSDVSTFSLPDGWSCRLAGVSDATPSSTGQDGRDTELEEILVLQKVAEEQEASNLRRSTRAGQEETVPDQRSSSSGVEFYRVQTERFCKNESSQSRLQVELVCEKDHEEKYAMLYYKAAKAISSELAIGLYLDGSFPPYIGHVVSSANHYSEEDPSGLVWEIRDTYLVPALRWILRGLFQSEHLHEYEEAEAGRDASLLPNNVYYLDPNEEPFDLVDAKELSRRKRTNDAVEESSDEDVELSAYEKERADRVARNAERLKALGLA